MLVSWFPNCSGMGRMKGERRPSTWCEAGRSAVMSGAEWKRAGRSAVMRGAEWKRERSGRITHKIQLVRPLKDPAGMLVSWLLLCSGQGREG